MPLKYLIFCLCLAGSFSGFAQELIFTNLGVNNGIPASESYNVFQDSKGYIWFSTEAGLCKYNGSQITVFDKSNGLEEKGCYGICENPRGKLWFITSRNRVLYYDRKTDQLNEAAFSKALQKLVKQNPVAQVYSIKPYSDVELWLNTQWESFKVNTVNGKVEEIKSPINDVYTFQLTNGKLFNCKKKIVKPFINEKDPAIRIAVNGSKNLEFSMPWPSKLIPQYRCLTASNTRGDVFIAMDNLLVKIDRNKKVSSHVAVSSILSLHCDKQNDLWIGTAKGGVYLFGGSLLTDPVHSLESLSVTGICRDFENGIWCSTLEKGVFYCRSMEVVSYTGLDGLDKRQDLFKTINNTLYCGNDGRVITTIDAHNIKQWALNNSEPYLVRDVMPYQNGFLLASFNGVASVDKDFSSLKFIKEQNSDKIRGASIIIELPDNELVFSSGNSVFLMDKTSNVLRKEINLESSCNTMAATTGEAFFGCKDGLYSMNLSDHKIQRVNEISGYVSSILVDRNNAVWSIQREGGIFIRKNGKWNNVSSRLNVESFRLFDIVEDKQGIIWLASNHGLLRIHNNNSLNYSVYDGIPSNEINKLAVAGNHVFMSTYDGVFRISTLNDIRNRTSPPVFLRSVTVNGNKISSSASLTELSYDQNSILVTVDAITYKNLNYPSIEYSLTNARGEILRSGILKGNLIAMDNLYPDAYTLTVKTVNTDGIKSLHPLVLNIKIDQAFWKTPMFIVLGILTGLTMISIIIILIVNQIKRKEAEKTKLNKTLIEYRLSALQAQMNPHFIFNAINSIQTYILENETRAAYDYLAKFAKLIRMVLNNAKEKKLSLENELELIKTYIDLEQMRFEHKFDFEITLDPAIDTYQMEIPPMLIQPYIENAIWHGLMPLNDARKGKLDLNIKLDNKQLVIVIEDNGIGREASQKIKKSNAHVSVGMGLTETRLEVMNSLGENGISTILVFDCFNDSNQPLGTRVEIYLPTTMMYE